MPPGFCYVIAEFPIAYCCIWHVSCLGTLHSAFSRVLREYPVGVRVKAVHSVAFSRVLREYPVGVRVKAVHSVAFSRVLREYPVGG